VFLVSDQFKMIRSPKFETGIGECVALGTKIDVDQIVHTTGGGATNAAVTFARLGFTTAAVCRVGEDKAGEEIVWDLEGDGVDTSLVKKIAGGQTGYSTLLTAPSGERSVLVYLGRL
jgi:sugar/nucleoside kinase (ribokinase family)